MNNNNEEIYDSDNEVKDPRAFKFGMSTGNTFIINPNDNELFIKNNNGQIICHYRNPNATLERFSDVMIVDNINKKGITYCTTYNRVGENTNMYRAMFYNVDKPSEEPVERYL